MRFSSGNLTVTKTDNSSGVYALSDLRYLNFSDITDITTDLQEDLSVQSQMLKVYPNPAKDKLNIKSDDAIESLELYDSLGRKVLSQSEKFVTESTINVFSLTRGIYILKLRTAGGIEEYKVAIE